MAFLDGILSGRRRPARPVRQRRPEPFQPGPDDVYLVSYPRSGSTWVRAVAAEAMFGTSGESLEDLDRYCPDIHARTPAETVVPAPFHFVKSHWPRSPRQGAANYRRVVYLLRDCRDVVLSHFRYVSQLGLYAAGFDDFLTDWLCGRIYPCSWAEHVTSWLGPPGAPAECSLLTVRYEDLLAEPAERFGRVLDFLGTRCERQHVVDILERSSPERMRQKEARGMRPGLRADELEFVGPARSGQGDRQLTEQQLTRLREAAEGAMRIAGYL